MSKHAFSIPVAAVIFLVHASPLLAGGAAARPPRSIDVPLAATREVYTVKWKPSAMMLAAYELQEATDPGFATGVRVAYKGTETAVPLSGRTNGQTYYYRVRAIRKYFAPSRWVVGANGCLVRLTVDAPSTVTVPALSTTLSYQVSWGGSLTPGASYELEEATAADFTAELRRAYAGGLRVAQITERPMGTTYYYRVRAVRDGWYPSGWVEGANGCLVTDFADCEGCHNGNPEFPLAPNVINGPLPSSDGLSYNWYGTDPTRQDGGHGDAQGRDVAKVKPVCRDCHDLSQPAPGTSHGNGVLESVFDDATRNANTAHLKADFFTKYPANAPGTWSLQVAFDRYCLMQCHAGGRVPTAVSHDNDTRLTDPNHYSVEMGTHGTLANGDALGGEKRYPMIRDLTTDAPATPFYAACVTCHDPHGTTVAKMSKFSPYSNRMMRDNWGTPPTLCNACHL